MALELGRIPIQQIHWGRKTFIQEKTPHIDREELIEKATANDPRITSIKAEIARPGESTRIIPAKDVVEPRVKAEGSGRGSLPIYHGGRVVGCFHRHHEQDEALKAQILMEHLCQCSRAG